MSGTVSNASRRQVRLVLRLKAGKARLLGPGKVELLELIDETGSISGAAREMGLSYRQAWVLVEAMNQVFRRPVVATTLGGRHGGGAGLTPTGKRVLSLYRQLARRARAAVAPELRALARIMTLDD